MLLVLTFNVDACRSFFALYAEAYAPDYTRMRALHVSPVL